MLDGLYQRAGLAVASTQLVSFAAGPGGFTGVRIAASIAQGVAMACNCKVVPQRGSSVVVNSWSDDSGEKDRALCLVVSRGQSFYVSEYAKESSQWKLQRPDELHEQAPQWLDDPAQHYANDAARLVVLGVTPDWLPKQLNNCCVGAVTPDAQHMVVLLVKPISVATAWLLSWLCQYMCRVIRPGANAVSTVNSMILFVCRISATTRQRSVALV